MFIKKITLTNFRNYSHLNFDFSSPITILLGENAQGKSNFLEAVFFLASSKSYKAEKEDELVKEGEEAAHVQGVLEGDTTLEIAIQIIEGSLKKRIKVNGIPRRVNDYTNNLVAVLFSPEDINMVTGSPSLRRRHVDITLSQVDRDYKRALSSYEEVVMNKNRLLKRIREGLSKRDELTFWADQQILLGNILCGKRRSFFEFLNREPKKFGNFNYKYIPNEISLERLYEYQQREIDAAISLIGPHRDDFCFFQDDKDLSKYGSRGEQRTVVLDLKIAEVSFIEHKLSTRPILLLDDIFSELDLKHQEHVIDMAKLQQTVITSVDMDVAISKELTGADFYSVEDGVIKKMK